MYFAILSIKKIFFSVSFSLSLSLSLSLFFFFVELSLWISLCFITQSCIYKVLLCNKILQREHTHLYQRQTPSILSTLPFHHGQILERCLSQITIIAILEFVIKLMLWEPLEHFHFSHGGLKMQLLLGCRFGDQVRERTRRSQLWVGAYTAWVQDCSTTWRAMWVNLYRNYLYLVDYFSARCIDVIFCLVLEFSTSITHLMLSLVWFFNFLWITYLNMRYILIHTMLIIHA